MEYNEGLGSIRTKKAPKKTIKAYKLMRLVDGKLYPLFIDSSVPTEIGVWYDADSTSLDSLRDKEAGFYYLMSNEGDVIRKQAKKPTKTEVEDVTKIGLRYMYVKQAESKQRRYGGYKQYYNVGINGSGAVSPTYAIRPGWHAGSLPTMRQIGKGSNKDKRDDSFVWTEVELSADVDYNPEAQRNPDKDIPDHIPEDGYYMKATNADKKKSQADLVGWYVAGAMKINRIISDKEARQIIDRFNAKHPGQKKVEYDYDRESGKEFDAGKMMLEGISSVLSGLGMNEVLNFIDKEIRIAQAFAQQPKGSIPSYQRQNMNQRVTGRLETLWKNRDYDTFNKALDKIKEAGVIFSKNNSIWERHKNTPTEDLYPSPEFKNAMNVIAKLKPNMDVDNETLKWAIEYPIRKLASENRVRSLRVVVQALKDKQDKEGITIFEPDEWFWKYLQSDTEEAINKENPESGVIYEADGCTVEDNVELSRVQIFFPGKPSYEIISYLKQHGFRWSPSNKAWQRQNTPEGRRQALDFAKKFFPEELKKEVDEVVEEVEEKPIENKTKNSYEFEYQLLGRLKDDCDYYLGNGNRFAKQLWAGNEIDQIKKMVELWDMLPEKPEWLNRNELERYSMALTGKSIDELYKSNDGSSSLLDFANGLSTLLTQGKVTWAEAQKIATEMNLKASNQELIQACELAVVMAARKIAQTDYTIRAKYEQIRDLYDNQPTIQPKDGESRFLQQFSTPAPLAFMAGEFVKVNDNYNSAYLEPTAGNGMLTIALPADRTCVNELDVIRYNNLTTQGFLHVSNQDATKYSVPNKMPTGGLFHGVITNPPFADLKRNEYLIRRGKKGDKEIEYTFTKLDYKLAIMALDQMANNGRAAIIVGGKLGSKVYDFKNAYWNKNDMLFGEYASFVAYLNRQYNLVDILYISGDLYAKQGTTFPIIMLLIDGRKQWDSSIDCVWHKYDPDKDAEIESFTEYFNRIYPHIEGNTETVNNDDKARKLRLAKAKAKALLLYAYAQKNKGRNTNKEESELKQKENTKNIQNVFLKDLVKKHGDRIVEDYQRLSNKKYMKPSEYGKYRGVNVFDAFNYEYGYNRRYVEVDDYIPPSDEELQSSVLEILNKYKKYPTISLPQDEWNYVIKNYKQGISKNPFYKVYESGTDAKYNHKMIDPIGKIIRNSSFDEFYGGGVVD